MTVGIICLDGLDHRLASDHQIFDPVSASMRPLVNDLSGEGRLFTPRVWNSLFLGEDQQQITGWLPEPKWKTATRDWDFLWDKVVGTSLLNVNVHSNYLHQRASIPDGWTSNHGSHGMIIRSTEELISHWNETLGLFDSALQIGYWRLPDSYGHWASKKGKESMADIYHWIREEFWDQIDLPDQYIVLSDHGFVMDPSTGEGGQAEHTEHGTVAATWDLPRRKMSGFIPTWHDMVISQVRLGNLDALGYV